jgi:histidinol dehydrogenase
MNLSRLTLEADPAEVAARARALAPPSEEVAASVSETLEAVRSGGDAALGELGERFDGVRPVKLRLERAELESAATSIDPALSEALTLAAENIRTVAKAQLREDAAPIQFAQGHAVTVRSVPIESVGIYVPGGTASYPSSVLMGCIPARVAGVARVAVATPPSEDGGADPNVLAACAMAEVDEVYLAGGAQAIGALAFGTETVDAVDLIAGPGSAWVQEAKLQVSRQVGIDSYAGPSELMVVLDESAPIDWLALDLCAQAEHGGAGLLAAAAADPALLDQLATAVALIVAKRPGIADAQLALIEVRDTESAVELANAIAPEHLQLACSGAAELAETVRTAGCVLVGASSATAFSDYAAGSNHILPTGGAGRFAGPLGPNTFRRAMSIVEIPAPAAAELAEPVQRLAEAEGFPVHGESVSVRVAGRPTGAVGKMGET